MIATWSTAPSRAATRPAASRARRTTGASAAVPYDPEFVTNYEVGGKFSILDRRLQANVAAFIMKYEDLQVRQRILLNPADPSSVINVTSNAAQATIQGVEIELTARPKEGLELWAAGSLLDATYDEFISGTTNFSGAHLPRSPEQTLTMGGKLTLPIGSAGEIALRAEVQYKGELFFRSRQHHRSRARARAHPGRYRRHLHPDGGQLGDQRLGQEPVGSALPREHPDRRRLRIFALWRASDLRRHPSLSPVAAAPEPKWTPRLM